MTSLRFSVVEKAFQAKPQPVAVPDCRPSEYFGKYVFNREKMFKYLPSTVYARLVDAMDNGAPMDRDIADEVIGGYTLYTLVSAADGRYRRKARCFCRT